MSVQWNGDQWFARHREALEAAMNQIGNQIVLETHESVNTPYPPASEPDEPPHRRTGLLAAGIRQDTTSDTSSVTTQIQSSRVGGMVPIYLEFGTSKMEPRPYMGPMKEKWAGEFVSALRESYGEHFGG